MIKRIGYSCKLHNEETSKDDEYVRNIIAMSIGGNDLGFNHFLNKVKISFEKSPALLKMTTQENKRIYTQKDGGLILPSLAFKIDRDRFNLVISKIAYALFYNKYGQVWKRELKVMTEFFRESDITETEEAKFISKFKPFLIPKPFDGKNPQVFKY